MSKQSYFKQFSLALVHILVLSSATTPSQSRPGSNSNEGVLHIPQRFSITGTLPSDCK